MRSFNRINPRAEKIMKTHLENGEQRITLVNPAGWNLLGYAVPFLSMEEQYQNGKDFLGGLTLTRPRKNSITAIKKERRVKNEAVFCTPFFTSQA